MKINELMIGNWVIAPDEDTRELREVKVARIKEKDIIMDKYYNVIFIETIAPIPITEEFLKANGFETQRMFADGDCAYLEEYVKAVGGYFLSIRKCVKHKDRDWCIHIDNADRCGIGCMDIQYVHQLQNVLNILGIEMEVVL